MIETITVTPTWRGILPMLLAAHDSGSFAAIKEAALELEAGQREPVPPDPIGPHRH